MGARGRGRPAGRGHGGAQPPRSPEAEREPGIGGGQRAGGARPGGGRGPGARAPRLVSDPCPDKSGVPGVAGGCLGPPFTPEAPSCPGAARPGPADSSHHTASLRRALVPRAPASAYFQTRILHFYYMLGGVEEEEKGQMTYQNSFLWPSLGDWFREELFILNLKAGLHEDNSVNFRNCFLW